MARLPFIFHIMLVRPFLEDHQLCCLALTYSQHLPSTYREYRGQSVIVDVCILSWDRTSLVVECAVLKALLLPLYACRQLCGVHCFSFFHVAHWSPLGVSHLFLRREFALKHILLDIVHVAMLFQSCFWEYVQSFVNLARTDASVHC